MHSEEFGTIESCGPNSCVTVSDYEMGLRVRPFFMIELNAKEINQTVGKSKFKEKDRAYFAIPKDVLHVLQMDPQTRNLIDHGTTFMDSLCTWKP